MTSVLAGGHKIATQVRLPFRQTAAIISERLVDSENRLHPTGEAVPHAQNDKLFFNVPTWSDHIN
jgi:hypothetical protein